MTNTNREHWLGCRMVYDASTEEVCYELPKEIEEEFHAYITRINKRPAFNVWYDEQNPKIFGADETYKNSPVPNEASFLDSKSAFINSEKYGLPSIARYENFANQEAGMKVHSDGFFEANPEMDKFKNSTILIVGGGPSTNRCDWQNVERDFTWTCNHFYRNEKIANTKIDLFYINAETHMGIPELSEYVKKHNPICAADTSITRPEHILQSFCDEKCNTLLFNMRMFLSSGAAPKLVNLAILAGAKEIKVVGMDGWTKEQIETSQAGEHAFENGKALNISSNYNFDFQRRETVVFWDYLLSTTNGRVKFTNLGETYKDNAHAEISKKMFPLDV